MKKQKLRRAYRNGRLLRGVGTWHELRMRMTYPYSHANYKVQ